MIEKSIQNQQKKHQLKKEAAASTVKYSKDCAARAFNLFRKENNVNITSLNEIDIKQFFIWLESTTSIAESTKKAYARSSRRELDVHNIKFKKTITERQIPTKNLFNEISNDMLTASMDYNSEESNYSYYIFILMSITGLDINSILNSKILPEEQEPKDYEINFDITIQTKYKKREFLKTRISKLPLLYYTKINKAFEYVYKIKDDDHKTISARIRYFIQKTLSQYGHTITSSKRSFPRILGFLEHEK